MSFLSVPYIFYGPASHATNLLERSWDPHDLLTNVINNEELLRKTINYRRKTDPYGSKNK